MKIGVLQIVNIHLYNRVRYLTRIFFFIHKVWCDVLFWSYDARGNEDAIFDIYNTYISTKFWLYKLEAIYRYSGILYDKLKHLLSYIYRNISYSTDLGSGNMLFRIILRFNANIMYPRARGEVNSGHNTPNYLQGSVAQSLHFINT